MENSHIGQMLLSVRFIVHPLKTGVKVIKKLSFTDGAVWLMELVLQYHLYDFEQGNEIL